MRLEAARERRVSPVEQVTKDDVRGSDALMLQMGWFESSLQLSYGILDGLIWILLETCRIVSSASNFPVKRYCLKSRCQRKLCLLTVVTCASDAGRLFSTWFACDCRENIFKAAYKLFSWIFSIALYIPLLHTHLHNLILSSLALNNRRLCQK